MSRQSKLIKKIAALKRKIERKKKEKPYKYLYTPLPKQEIFHRFTKKIGIFRGGNGAGKTLAGCLEALMTGYGYNPYRQIPDKKHKLIWIAGDTSNTVETIIMPKMLEWLPPEYLGKWSFRRRPRPELFLFDDSGAQCATIELKSYEQGRKAFQGAEPDLIILDEEPPEEIWNEILARTRKGGLIRITATPFGYGLIAKLLEHRTEDIDEVQVNIRDNTYLDPKEVEFQIKQFGEEINRIDGSIYVPEGLIYKTPFEKLEIQRLSTHDENGEPRQLQFWTATDLGGSDEFCTLFAYYDPKNDHLTIVDEYYVKGSDITAHANRIKAIESLYQPPHRRLYDNNNKIALREFNRMGLVGSEVEKASGSLSAGILITRARIEAGKLKVIQGKTPNLKKEYKLYRYSKRSDGEPASGQKDHALDALRYICMNVRPLKERKQERKYKRISRGKTEYFLGRFA